jgi:WD repeat-containing protein 70
MHLQLHVYKNDVVREIIKITELLCIFGRSKADVHILLDHHSISRKHCKLETNGNLFYITCLGSTHGTTVNGEKLVKDMKIRIQHDDIICFGKSSRTYKAFIENDNGNSIDSNNYNEAEVDDSSDDEFGPMPSNNSKEMNINVESSVSRTTTSKNNKREIDEMDPNIQDELDTGGEIFRYKEDIPVSHEITLGGHTKSITCFSVEGSGNRLVTCSLDSTMQIFDFGGMDSTHRSFRQITPSNGVSLNFAIHSNSSDRFIIVPSNSQPLIYDREGIEILKFCKGDMYIRDLSLTKGHTSEATCAYWHPTLKDIVLTGSRDGTVRSWDLTSALRLGSLQCKDVYRIRSSPGALQVRIGVTSCIYSYDGKYVIAGTSDGRVSIWDAKLLSRTKAVLRPYGENSDTAITCVHTINRSEGDLLVIRGHDGTVFFYMLRDIALPKLIPYRIIRCYSNNISNANFTFSPDGNTLCLVKNVLKSNSEFASLCFYLVDGKSSMEQVRNEQYFEKPYTQVNIEGIHSVTYIKWVHSTNHIFLGTSDGNIKALFNPDISSKGALLSYEKSQSKTKGRDIDSIDSIDLRNASWEPPSKRSKKNDIAPSKPPTKAHISEGSHAHLMQKSK